MVQHRKFMGLVLDDEGLHTPDGSLNLGSISRAEIVKTWDSTPTGTVGASGDSDSASSTAGVLGGALIGGAIAGPIGLVGGGLLGSTIKRKPVTTQGPPRTVSASLVFESPDLGYSTRVGRDLVPEAEAFVAAVRKAAGLSR